VSEQAAAHDRKMVEEPESPPLHDVQSGRSSDPNSRRDAWTLPKNISGHDRRWLDFVWLAYSAFFWIGPVLRNQLGYWIIFGCVYALFLGLYSVLVLGQTLRLRRAALIGLAVLGYIHTPFNEGFIGIHIYVAAFIPFVVAKTRNVVLLLLAICGSMLAQGYFMHLNKWGCSICTFLAFVTGGTNILLAQKRRATHELGLAHEEIERLAKLAERERIARDLHDVLGHTLSVVVLKSELAGRLFEQNAARARQEIGEVEQIARAALGDVRQAIRGYRSEGLVAEMERARTALSTAEVSLELEPSIPQLSPTEESVASLLVREAVTNIIRHASASSCKIEFQQNDEKTILAIEDNGRGGIRREGNGLRGMRERVASLGGNFHVDSSHGTRLMIEIPRQELKRKS
jgi:two-component system, NarL family, sensor histidine kinase DesK